MTDTIDIPEETKKRVIPQRSFETDACFQRISKMEPAAFVPYEEYSKLVGEKVTGAYPPLASARRMALNQLGIVTECVRGEGIKRQTDSGIVESSHDGIDRQRRAAKRQIRKLNCSNRDALDQARKVLYDTNATLYRLIAQETAKKAVEKLAAAVTAASAQLPIQKTLDVFKKD